MKYLLDFLTKILSFFAPKPEPIVPDSAPLPPKAPDVPQPVSTNPWFIPNPSKVYGCYPNTYPIDLQQKLIDRTKIICSIEGLNDELAEEVRCTIFAESGYNPYAENSNKDKNGKVLSTDFGIAQINSAYHIGKGKDFPSSDYVLNNPEACIHWMCKMFRAGKADMWMGHKNWRKFQGKDLLTIKSWYD